MRDASATPRLTLGQEIEQLDAGTLVAQVRAAREAAEMLSTRIRSTAVGFALEVETLLKLVLDTQLGLAGRHPRRPGVSDEMVLWQTG